MTEPLAANRRRKRIAALLLCALLPCVVPVMRWLSSHAERPSSARIESLPWPLETRGIRNRTVRKYYACWGRPLPPVLSYAIAYENVDHMMAARMAIETTSDADVERSWSRDCETHACVPVQDVLRETTPFIAARIRAARRRSGTEGTTLACEHGTEIRHFSKDTMWILVDRLGDGRFEPSPPPSSIR